MFEEFKWTLEQCQTKIKELKKQQIFNAATYNDPKIKALRQQYWRCMKRIKFFENQTPKKQPKPYTAHQIAKLMAEMQKKNKDKRKGTGHTEVYYWSIDKLLKRYLEIRQMGLTVFGKNSKNPKIVDLKNQSMRIVDRIVSLTGKRPNELLGLFPNQKISSGKKRKLTAEEKRIKDEQRKENNRNSYSKRKAAQDQAWLAEFNKKFPSE